MVSRDIKGQFKKIMLALLLVILGLNILIDLQLANTKDTHASSLMSDLQCTGVNEFSRANDEPSPFHCSDPCHVGDCHFGHCGHTLVPTYHFVSDEIFLDYIVGYFRRHKNPNLSALRRPPRRA